MASCSCGIVLPTVFLVTGRALHISAETVSSSLPPINCSLILGAPLASDTGVNPAACATDVRIVICESKSCSPRIVPINPDCSIIGVISR